MDNIELKFKNRALQRGGIFLLKRDDAIRFVEECQLQRIEILGVDGFIITDDKTEPSMEHSIDISNRPFNQGDYNMLKQFIFDKDNSLYFEIVWRLS